MMHSTLKDPKANNHKIDIGLNEDFIEIINCNLEKMAPFMMFFLRTIEALVYFVFFWARYYPMRFYLSVAEKLPSFFKEVGNTKVL